MRVQVEIGSVLTANRITTHPSCNPGRIVPKAKVIQPALLVPLLARVAIALLDEAAEARLTIGKVFLAINPHAAVVRHYMTVAKMIAVVVLRSRTNLLWMSLT